MLSKVCSSLFLATKYAGRMKEGENRRKDCVKANLFSFPLYSVSEGFVHCDELNDVENVFSFFPLDLLHKRILLVVFPLYFQLL